MKEKCYCVYREDAYGKNKLLYAFKKEEDAKWYAYIMNNDTDRRSRTMSILYY